MPTRIKFAMHRAAILNEMTKMSKANDNPRLFCDDERLIPKNLKNAANFTPFHVEPTQEAPAIQSPTPILAVISKPATLRALPPEIQGGKNPYILYCTAAIKDREREEALPPSINQQDRYISRRLIYTLQSNYEDITISISPYLIIFLITAIFLTLATTGRLIPPDDYARHAKAYQYGYDYTRLYPYSQHPTYNIYLLFDNLAGKLQQAVGNDSAAFFQVIPLLMTMMAVLRLTRPAKDNMASLILIATFFFTWHRFQSARPCIVMTSIFLLAYAYRDKINRITHFAIGLLMAALYYIFFLYTAPLILGRKTFLPYAAATLAGLAFWQHYSAGGYFTDLQSLATTSLQLKKLGIEYAELKPVLGSAILPNLAALIPMALYFKKDTGRTVTAGFYLLLNQVRYLETAIPLSLTFLAHSKTRISALAVVASLTIMLKTLSPINYNPITLPSGSTILTYSSTLMNTIVAGSDNIAIAPTPNLPWDDETIRRNIIKTVKTGTFDCSILQDYPFDYIVENQFTQVPQCLQLQTETPQARIWRPKNNAPHGQER